MRPIRLVHVLLACVGVALGPRPAPAALCAGSRSAPLLCPAGAGDCVVSASCSLPSDLVIDLGARRLVIGERKQLTVEAPGRLTVTANGIELLGAAVIAANGTGSQHVRLVSTSASAGVRVGANARIDASASGGGGEVLLDSAGPVSVDGTLRAIGSSDLGAGGTVSIFAMDDVWIGGGGIAVSGGARATGGDIDITTLDGAPVTVRSDLKLQGDDGGRLLIAADGNVDVAGVSIDVAARLAGGYGGDIDIAGLDVSIAARVAGAGREDVGDFGEPAGTGGEGAAVAITAAGRMFVNADFDLRGAPSGTGGDFGLDAGGNLTLIGTVLAGAEGRSGSGNEFVQISSTAGDITIGAQIDAAGGQSGGAIDVFTLSDGGTVTVSSTGRLRADALGGLPANELVGGTIALDGCAVAIEAGAMLSATGPRRLLASNTVRARTRMAIAGALAAGMENRLEYRDDPGIVSILSPGADIQPRATLVRQPSLSCCGAGCPVPGTTSSTSTTSTTSSTATPTTATSSPSTSTTTPSASSTSQPGSTTSTSASTSSTAVTATTVTSTTTTVESPTTTQPAPSPCGDAATPYAAATCRLERVRERLEGASQGDLGGKATASRLRASLRQAARSLDAAERGKKVEASLRRALRQTAAFEKTVGQGLQRKRRQIDPEVGETLLSLSRDARSAFALLQANAP